MVIELLCDKVTHLTTMDADILPSISLERCLPTRVSIAHDDPLEHIKGKKTIRPSSDDDKRDLLGLREEVYLVELLDIRMFMHVKKIPSASRSLERGEECDIVIELEERRNHG